MSDKKFFNIELVTLDNIVVTNASIANNSSLISLSKDKYMYEINNQFHIAGNREHNRMRVILNTSINTLERENKVPVDVNANFEISFFFLIENLKELMDDENNYANFEMTVALANISYSTSRGILFTRLQGTILKSFMLPILSNDEIIDMFKNQATSE